MTVVPKGPEALTEERCIFCERPISPDQRSDEHVFPYAIGGALIIEMVCKRCNDRLGEIADGPLVDSWIVRWLRAFLRIRNRSGGLVSVPARLSADERVIVDITLGGSTPEMVPRKRVYEEVGPNGSKGLWMSPATEGEAQAAAQRMRKRRGIEVDVTMFERDLSGAVLVGDGAIDCALLYPGVVKIAFELAHHWFGERYVRDPVCESLRAWFSPILDGASTWVQPIELRYLDPLYRGNPFPDAVVSRPEHVAFLARDSLSDDGFVFVTER
jgi:HNH endonuclease